MKIKNCSNQRVFTFPSPRPQFVFDGPSPQFVFSDPGPQSAFTGPQSLVCIYRPWLI